MWRNLRRDEREEKMNDEKPKGLDKSDEDILDKNLFMVCRQLNEDALSEMPNGYHIRHCREDELDVWKAMPFDDPQQAKAHHGFMTDYFANVYAHKGHLFYDTCLFVCDCDDKPIGTVFIWKAYDEINTVHWFKVLKSYEGKGIGRALFSVIMRDLKVEGYPVYLHTQLGCYRAIKLYSDFGFDLLTDPMIGRRQNDLEFCLPWLKKYMTNEAFENLRTVQAPKCFLEKLDTVKEDEF